MAIELNIASREIENISSGDGIVLDPLDGEISGSIGALFELRLRLEIGGTDDLGAAITNFANVLLYFNPALFWPNGQRVPAYAPAGSWSIQFPNSLLPTSYTMNLVGCGANTNNNVNQSCVIERDIVAMILKFRFRCTMDVGNFIIPVGLTNRSRLLRGHTVDLADFVTATPGVYNALPTNIGAMLVVSKAKAGSQRTDEFYPFGARFYNRSLTGADGTAELGTPDVTMTRGGPPVLNLSAFEDTLVTFTWPKNSDWNAGPFCETILIDTSNSGNLGGTYLQDYGNDFIVGTINDGGTVWTCAVNVPAASITFGRTYGIAVVARAVDATDATNIVSNSFIHGATASSLPAPLPLGPVAGSLSDYNVNPETDYVITTVVDHLKAHLIINENSYEVSAGSTTWATNFGNDLARIIVKAIDTGDSSTVWTRSFSKVAGVWQNDIGGTSDAKNVVVVTTDPDGNTIDLEIEIPYLNEIGFPDFAGKTIELQWSLVVSYPSLSWMVSYDYFQAFTVRDFQGFTDVIESITLIDPLTGIALQNLCDSDEVIVRAKLNMGIAGADTWNLRAYWNVEGYGYSNPDFPRPNDGTAEEEGYPSFPGTFAQLDDANLIGVQAVFDTDGIAQFVFNHADIPVGEKVRLYIIAQRTQCEAFTPVDSFVPHPDYLVGTDTIDVNVAASLSSGSLGAASYTVNGGGPVSFSVSLGATSTIGPFNFGDVIVVRIVNDDSPSCSLVQTLNLINPCATYLCDNSTVVLYADTADQQSTYEGAFSLPGDLNKSVFITDLPSSAMPGNTLWEVSTGKIAYYVGPGNGDVDPSTTLPSPWNIVALPGNGREVLVSSTSDPEDVTGNQRYRIYAETGSSLYPSGLFGHRFLQRFTPTIPTIGVNTLTALIKSVFTDKLGNGALAAKNCRFVQFQVTSDVVISGGSVWTDVGSLMIEPDFIAGASITIPGGTHWIRAKYTATACGPGGQGTSTPQAVI